MSKTTTGTPARKYHSFQMPNAKLNNKIPAQIPNNPYSCGDRISRAVNADPIPIIALCTENT